MMKKRMAAIIVLLLLLMAVLPVYAKENDSRERLLPRLVDEADLLTDKEEAEVLENLDEISERQQFDVTVACVNSLEGADTCDELITRARDGNPYDVNSEKSVGVSKIWIPGSLLLGFLLAGFPMSMMKKDMKNVRMQATASGYVREGSQNITKQTDMFLYHTVNRTKKPEKEGGSSTHSSSFGKSHGGGGGRF